jgi:TolB-like protein
VVLPFANIGGDPEQEYFVDGVTESLTTDLSRINGAFVIARNTAFTFKGKAVDVKKLGRELNVRYVLEGSVQRGGNRIRVNVQLIDAETGTHLWADRFDKPLADLFDMQDEIVGRLANQLGTELITVEAQRAKRSPHPDSTDLYFQGMAWLNKGLVEAAGARHFRMRASVGAGSKLGRCAREHRPSQVFHGSRRGNRGTYPRGAPHQSDRHERLYMVRHGGLR